MSPHRERAGAGQVAVETALTVPMTICFVLGTVQLGSHEGRGISKAA